MKKLYIFFIGIPLILSMALIYNVTPIAAPVQTVDSYFEKIRNNEAELTAFMAQMPKGGDLHHHYTGSVYAETYISYVVSHDYWINKNTLEVLDKKPATGDDWACFSSLKKEGQLSDYEDKLFQKWSIKDYNHVDYPSDKLFFET